MSGGGPSQVGVRSRLFCKGGPELLVAVTHGNAAGLLWPRGLSGCDPKWKLGQEVLGHPLHTGQCF